MLRARLTALATTAALAGMLLGSLSAAQAETATAGLKSADGKDVGTVTLTETPHGVLLSLSVKGLPPGEHAFHVHAVGKCEPPFTTAGGHFNPEGKKHGLENPDGCHAGDMLNFTVDAKGVAKATIVNKNVNLGSDTHSLFSNGGTALVIHAKADDMKTDPEGNAGDRIACGVVPK